MSKSQITNNKNKDYVYVLGIKRSRVHSFEVIGVYSNISLAKKEVISTYNKYINYLKEYNNINKLNNLEKYNNKYWEHSKLDNRFYFYTLNNDASSYYAIMKVVLNESNSVKLDVYSKESDNHVRTFQKEQ